MTDLLTPRAYLVTLGLAKEFADDGVTPARGRFSKEATAALDKAKAEGMVFAEPTPKAATATPKAPKPPKQAAVPAATVQAALRPQVDPKEVRAWAKQNGHTVGDRGRIHGDVVSAFLAAGGKVVTAPTAKRVTPLDMPRRRPENSGFTTVGGVLIRQDRCGKGNHSVAQCNCEGGPQAYGFLVKEHGAPLALTLDKPSL